MRETGLPVGTSQTLLSETATGPGAETGPLLPSNGGKGSLESSAGLPTPLEERGPEGPSCTQTFYSSGVPRFTPKLNLLSVQVHLAALFPHHQPPSHHFSSFLCCPGSDSDALVPGAARVLVPEGLSQVQQAQLPPRHKAVLKTRVCASPCAWDTWTSGKVWWAWPQVLGPSTCSTRPSRLA